MKGKWRAALACCLIGVSINYGELVTSESNVFTFPPITRVVVKNILPQQSYFKHSTLRPNSRTVTFTWSFPEALSEKNGVITIYSLLGKVLAKIPVQQKAGSAIWRLKNGTTLPLLPRTFPNRTETYALFFLLAKSWTRSSATRLVAPIILDGFTALSVEIRTNRLTS